MPALGVYFVNPASNASIAAFFMCSGVSKSGSPAPKPQTSMPSAFMALALLSIERVSEGLSWAARSEISIGIGLVVGWFKMERKLLVVIEVFNQRFEIILVDSNDTHFAFCVLRRIRCVRGVDHDGLPEFSSDRPWRRLRRIGWAEHVANLAHGVHTLINNGDRFFRAGSVAFFRRTFAGLSPGHEFDDAFPVFAAALWAELLLENRQHRTVEILGLRNAHLMNFESDDGETRARKYFDDAAGPEIWKPEIVRLDQDQCLFDLCISGEGDDSVEDPTVRIRKIRPEFQITLDRLWVKRSQDSRFKVGHFA